MLKASNSNSYHYNNHLPFDGSIICKHLLGRRTRCVQHQISKSNLGILIDRVGQQSYHKETHPQSSGSLEIHIIPMNIWSNCESDQDHSLIQESYVLCTIPSGQKRIGSLHITGTINQDPPMLAVVKQSKPVTRARWMKTLIHNAEQPVKVCRYIQ